MTEAKRKNFTNRGGSGIVILEEINNLLVGERNITLGLNIPNYPIEPAMH
jgi:protocatechuate 3,4-dioxygenase beta subunit